MKISQTTWSIILILVSLSTLGLEYGVVGFESTDITIPLVTINGFKINNPEALRVVVLFVLIISALMQLAYTIPELKSHYSAGYKNLSLVEFVTNHIAGICGHKAFGAPFGNFKPGLFKKPINPGSFISQNGRFSGDISVEIPSSIHFESVFSGLWSAATSKSMFFGMVSVILGIWSIVITMRSLVNAI